MDGWVDEWSGGCGWSDNRDGWAETRRQEVAWVDTVAGSRKVPKEEGVVSALFLDVSQEPSAIQGKVDPTACC